MTKISTSSQSESISKLHYEKRLQRVTDYIHEHLDEDIDLNRLADIAHMSPHHWHRVYHGLYGETIAATVKRLRLQRAAAALAHTDTNIDAIGKQCGYPNRQSFTRIFKAAYGMPPAAYRRSGDHLRYTNSVHDEDNTMYDVKIETLQPNQALAIEHQGDYLAIGRTFENLLGWLSVRDLIQPDIRMVGVYYCDINSVPTNELRSHACVITNTAVDTQSPVEHLTVAGGDYAILTHKGPYSDLKVAYDWFYGQWLVKSGREAANEPVFEEYLNNPQDTAPTDLLTKVCMPLAA